ncbi:hypothetical protein HAX54_052386 [Datura stramonium]|uniref:Saccharopine dehydrogenase NADP binding domain-containing protein n=1 Tax=Datura stramonium TaxID=4076 RepID=A0ABS8WS55_DATST|nr:hypothetical protein [Datura stramonium]
MIKLAIAGRSTAKLSQALQWASGPNPPPKSHLAVDTTDPSSIRHLASRTKIILNCVGPFRLYGEPVVEHVLIRVRLLGCCGEPEFMERMENRTRIVGNLGTYESAVSGVANADKLQELRRSRPRGLVLIPGTSPRGPLVNHLKEVGLWAVKLPSADATVVRRTLSCLAEDPRGLPGVNESTKQIERREAFWSSIKPILWKRVQLRMKWQVLPFKMWFIGQGFSGSLVSQGNRKPDVQIITRVMGPEIGNLTTPIILVQCALILLKERDSLPRGGVFPPGIVFGPTDLQDRLQQNGISFDVISKKTV